MAIAGERRSEPHLHCVVESLESPIVFPISVVHWEGNSDLHSAGECEKQRRAIPQHIALQLHATPTVAGQGLMRAERSGLSVVLFVGVPLFPCVLWCRRFLGDDTTLMMMN